MGWSSDMMWEATDKYRSRFAVAEEWRQNIIGQARMTGKVILPDFHERVRFENTHMWQRIITEQFAQLSSGSKGIKIFGEQISKAISRRAGNQLVNAAVQGTSATLAKRSILRINKMIKDEGIRGRFLMPVHDELIYSVHKDDMIYFIRKAKEIMANHPDIFKSLVIDSTAAIGVTFGPWTSDNTTGQVELSEAPPILGFEPDSELNDNEIGQVIEYLMEEKVKNFSN